MLTILVQFFSYYVSSYNFLQDICNFYVYLLVQGCSGYSQHLLAGGGGRCLWHRWKLTSICSSRNVHSRVSSIFRFLSISWATILFLPMVAKVLQHLQSCLIMILLVKWV